MYLCFGIFFVFLILMEFFYRANDYEKKPFWKTRALFITTVTLSSALLFSTWFDSIAPNLSIINISNYLPDPLAGLLGFIWATLAIYWWHRAMHENDFLWRTLHQLHHSPHRLELIATFYTHPFNAISVSFFGSIMVHIIGLSLNAVAWYSIIYSMVSMFNHANINAPGWIGSFIQTPNMHRIHHEYESHQSNYSEVTLWDRLFGTYRNPGGNPERCGFDEDKEVRMFAMLATKDVYKK